MTTEGIDQLETYYRTFLPQFFYSMLAPLTLFVFTSFIHLPTAFVLLLLVTLIPIAIFDVQRIAKRLLGRYWGQYAKLSDSFPESLMGLTTLKIFQADGKRAREMAEKSEHFRSVMFMRRPSKKPLAVTVPRKQNKCGYRHEILHIKRLSQPVTVALFPQALRPLWKLILRLSPISRAPEYAAAQAVYCCITPPA